MSYISQIIFIAFLIISGSRDVIAQSIELKPLSLTDLGFKGSFSAVHGLELIDPTFDTYRFFNDAELKKLISSEGLLKVSQSKVNSQIIKGVQLNVLNLNSGTTNTFEVKDELYIRIFTSENSNEFSDDDSEEGSKIKVRKENDLFRIFLSNDPKEVANQPDNHSFDGISFKGSNMTFKAKPVTAKFIDLPNTDAELKKIIASHQASLNGDSTMPVFKLDKASKAKINSHEIFFIEGKYFTKENSDEAVSGIVIKLTENNYLTLNNQWRFPNHGIPQRPIVGDWFNGSDFAFFYDTQTMHHCPNVYLFKDGKAQEIPVSCISGGC